MKRKIMDRAPTWNQQHLKWSISLATVTWKISGVKSTQMSLTRGRNENGKNEFTFFIFKDKFIILLYFYYFGLILPYYMYFLIFW